MIGKLSQLGLPSSFLDFLNNYLLPRDGVVRVEGALSDVIILCDMVFQGTVLGPALWNAFFADVAVEVPSGKQEMNLFADDLTVMTCVAQSVSDHILEDELKHVQSRTHAWGRRNQVEFDPGKEFIKIIHPTLSRGDDFKLLGTLFDCALTMLPCIEKLLAKIRPKVRALLRLRHIYSTAQMIGQYKTHIWGHKEFSNGALIMAAPSQVRRLDKLQRWYLRELDLTDTEAFVNFNFAPPSLRRGIGLLGFLHKRVLGVCHPALFQALLFASGLLEDYPAAYHDKALYPFSAEVLYQRRRLYDRSLYSYIHMYNRLPQAFIDLPTVSTFQSKLTHLTKERAKADSEHWRASFQDLSDVLKKLYDQ